MKYHNTIEATFLNRPNRFIANVMINGIETTVHVKNTGRCRELLIPGTKVILEKAPNPTRKTPYDLIAVYKKDFGLVNIDSQAPNKAALEWLQSQDYSYIKPEYSYGDSRMDFYMEKDDEKYLMEVKGCTLEVNGTGYFPDAPTERGVRHIRELMKARQEGYHAILAFVIQMEGIDIVLPNAETHPEFAEVFYEAIDAGVEVLYLKCMVNDKSITIA
ncbi:MAG: DNA/RNA nuclease SfsA [Blautia sp.]|nr:DNA/RNA nuclease SfsA [Blautia sp.]